MTSDQDVVPAEMLDGLLRRMLDIHHHEIRLGVDGLQRSTGGIIEKLLAVVTN